MADENTHGPLWHLRSVYEKQYVALLQFTCLAQSYLIVLMLKKESEANKKK